MENRWLNDDEGRPLPDYRDFELSDTKIDCVECGKTFVLSLGEQRWFKDKGFSSPKRCPDCRAERRKEREESTRDM